MAMLPCVLLLLLVAPAVAFVPPSQPRSPASSLQGWEAVPLQPLPRLPEGEVGMAGLTRGRPRADLSRLAAAGKGFGKNVNKGGADDGGKKKPQQQPASSSSNAGGSAQGQVSGGVVRPPLGGTVQTPRGEVPRKFQMLYTCNICDGRNLITVDRIAFTEGIVVAKCKHCDAKHLVADNLSKLDFGKGKVTLDDILALRGEKAERVDLASNPDLAKYDLQQLEDGTVELMPKEEGQA